MPVREPVSASAAINPAAAMPATTFGRRPGRLKSGHSSGNSRVISAAAWFGL